MKKLDNLINDEDYLKDTKILKEKRDNIQNEINKYNDLKSNINEENILELKKNIQQENNIINNNTINNKNSVTPENEFSDTPAQTLFPENENWVDVGLQIFDTKQNENKEKKVAPKKESTERKTLFRNSEVYKMVKFDEKGGGDYSKFEACFNTPEFAPVDLVYYFHCVADWSDQKNMKRTKNGWLATVRNFIRGDVERKKLHLKTEHQAPQNRINVAGAMEYLKDDY